MLRFLKNTMKKPIEDVWREFIMFIWRKMMLVSNMVLFKSINHHNNNVFSIKGEIGETFWITLKGKVAILIPKEKETIGKDGKAYKEKVPVKVASGGAGYAFGELALLERKPRQATIVCEEDSDFAILDKEHFQQILRIYRLTSIAVSLPCIYK